MNQIDQMILIYDLLILLLMIISVSECIEIGRESNRHYYRYHDNNNDDSANEVTLQSIFLDLKAIIPKSNSNISDIINSHDSLINILQSRAHQANEYHGYNKMFSGRRYNPYSSSVYAIYNEDEFQEEHIDEKETTSRYEYNPSININLHNDIVFIGFSSNTVEYLRNTWFENIGHKDHMLYSFKRGLENKVTGLSIPSDVDTTITNHFHLVKISFSVADAIRDRLKILLNLSNLKYDTMISNQTNYLHVNTWEMEEILESLSQPISDSHMDTSDSTMKTSTKRVKTTSTFYILNLMDLLPPGYEIIYHIGFTHEELLELSKMQDIVLIAHSIKKDKSRKTRIDESDNELSLMLSSTSLLSSVTPYDENSTDVTEQNSNFEGDDQSSESINWRDAILATKLWAYKLNEETETLRQITLLDRAKRILNSSPGTTLNKYRLTLASQILNILAESDTSSDNILETQKQTLRSQCSTNTWISSGRVLWSDINSADELRLSHQEEEESNATSFIMSPPISRLSESEWLLLGDRNSINDILNDIKNLEIKMIRYLESVKALYLQSSCPEDTLDKLLNSQDFEQSLEDYFNNALFGIMGSSFSYYGYASATDPCSHYISDVGFINATIISSQRIQQLHNQHSSDDIEHINDILIDSLKLLRKALLEASSLKDMYSIMNSNEDPSSLHDHSIISDKAITMLGYLGGLVQHVYRSIVTPPMLLHEFAFSSSNDMTQSSQWFDKSLPTALVANKVDVTLFVVVTHRSYESIGSYIGDDKGLDYWSIMQEIQKLKLPGQDYSITLQIVNATLEQDLSLGLSICRRFTSSKINKNIKRLVYLDSQCLYSLIRKYDETTSSTNVNDQSRIFIPRVHHIPVFVISMDEEDPIFLDEDQQSVRIQDFVIAIQNKQRHISYPSKMCNQTNIILHGRNPMGAILLSIAEVISGLPLGYITHRGCGSNTINNMNNMNNKVHLISKANEMIWDWSSQMGSSPRFPFSQVHLFQFNDFDVMFIHRSRALRALTVAIRYASLAMKKYEDSQFITIQSSDDIAMMKVNKRLKHFGKKHESFIRQAIEFIEKEDWQHAIVQSNSAILLAIHTTSYLNPLIKYTKNSNIQMKDNPISSSNLNSEKTKKLKQKRQSTTSSNLMNLISFGRLILSFGSSVLYGILSYGIVKLIQRTIKMRDPKKLP